jgi:hypothetical protein
LWVLIQIPIHQFGDLFMSFKKCLLGVLLLATSVGFVKPAQAQENVSPVVQMPETIMFANSEVMYGGYLTRFETRIVDGKLVIDKRIPRPSDALPINNPPKQQTRPIVTLPKVIQPPVVLPPVKAKPKSSSGTISEEMIYRSKTRVSWYSPGDSGRTTSLGNDVYSEYEKFGTFVATRDIVPYGSIFYQVKCNTLYSDNPTIIKKIGPRRDWGPAEWTGRNMDVWVPSHAKAIENGEQTWCVVAIKGKK